MLRPPRRLSLSESACTRPRTHSRRESERGEEREREKEREKERERERALASGDKGGAAQVIEVLAQHGADVNARNEVDMTPMHYAAYHNRTAAVWALLR